MIRFSLRPKYCILLFLAVLSVSLSSSALAAQVFDVAEDFSITNGNPNDVWSYGYSSSLTGPITLYVNTSNITWGSSSFHSWIGNIGNELPAAVKNVGPSNASGGTGNLEPGQFALHPAEGVFSFARWTAPSAGLFVIDSVFSGRDISGVPDASTTDVHVLHNSISVFDGSINGFLDTSAFSASISMNVGDTIDFAVGQGTNTWAYDTTALAASIQLVPIPAAFPLFVSALGLVGFIGWKRRKLN